MPTQEPNKKCKRATKPTHNNTTIDRQTMTEKEGRTHNTGLAKVSVQCSADTFVVNQSLALHINICGENRHLRQALSVRAHAKNPPHKWHIWFFPTHNPTLKKPQEPFFANAPDDNNKLDIDKLLKNMFNILHHFRARLLPLTQLK
jgi:hypothetical protein